MNIFEFCKKLDAALERRKHGKFDDYENVVCEVCGDRIHRYIGPVPGIICTSCMEPTGEAECVRVMPLAITRGTMNERGH